MESIWENWRLKSLAKSNFRSPVWKSRLYRTRLWDKHRIPVLLDDTVHSTKRPSVRSVRYDITDTRYDTDCHQHYDEHCASPRVSYAPTHSLVLLPVWSVFWGSHLWVWLAVLLWPSADSGLALEARHSVPIKVWCQSHLSAQPSMSPLHNKLVSPYWVPLLYAACAPYYLKPKITNNHLHLILYEIAKWFENTKPHWVDTDNINRCAAPIVGPIVNGCTLPMLCFIVLAIYTNYIK